jgi:RND family efflux transporter MFP subunit
VATGKELFRIADLSVVWVIGQVYEKDLPTVKLGTVAGITTPAASGRTLTGRVSYIDPKIDPQTRTAQVRIEVANPGELLKIGMFVDVGFGVAPQAGVHQEAVTVSKAAIQLIGSRQVVFVATDQPGVFVQREVKAGAESDGRVIILGGVSAGERVVTDGSFLLRAERLKQRPDH